MFCSLCALQFLVQFMCTVVIGAVYVYCGYRCSLCVLLLLVQFMCTVSICAVYGYCIILYNLWLLFYVMQFMSTAYLIQFMGSHFRQCMSLRDYWILMQLMYCDTMYVLQFMCTAVCGAVYVYCGYWCSLYVYQ